MKGIYSERSLGFILSALGYIDRAIYILDELPESEHLAGEIEALLAVIAKLEAVLKDEGF